MARSFIGTAAIFAAMGLVGCSAESAGPGEEIGASEQPIRIKNSCDNTKTDLAGPGWESQFSSYAKLSNTDVLALGGYDHTGAAVVTFKKGVWNGAATPPTFVFSKLQNGGVDKDLATARAEAAFAPIPGVSNKFVFAGGRSAVGGTPLSSVALIDITTNAATAADIAGQALGQNNGSGTAAGKANMQIVPCGTGSKLLLIGGQSTGALASTSAALEVFDYNGGAPTIKPLVNKDNGTTAVTLTTARSGHGAYAFGNKIVVFGGNDGSNVLASTEIINVTDSCQFDDLDGSAQNVQSHPAAGANMPAARQWFVPAPVSLTISMVGYDLLAVGGDNGTTGYTTTAAYDEATDAWLTSMGTPSTSVAHVRPALALTGTTGTWAVVGGLDLPIANGSAAAIVGVDYYASNAFTSSPSLCQARYGAWASDFGGTYLAGMGSTAKSEANDITTIE